MNCPRCRQVLNERTRFCTNCGLATERIHTQTETVSRQITVKAAAATDPLTGRVLDSKYELGERLGEGGMGTVYRARRLHIGDEVAVKVLHQQFVRETSGIERFRREARSAALIRHANVVAIHDFSESCGEDASAYIVMELVRGRSLRDLLRQEGRLDPARAVALMRDICAGVGVAHRQGIVHRDLKPDNVIVVPPEVDGEHEMAKVLDFGLAKLREIASDLTLTQTGAVMGTPYYMSPEQWRGESLDARADVYSLGAMFYEMLTASPPFNSTSAAGLMVKHLNEPPPWLEPSLQITPALETVCQRALAKTADQRQADASVLSRELQAALSTVPVTTPFVTSREHQGIQPAQVSHPQWTAPTEQKTRRSLWIAAGLLVLLVATIIAAIAIRNMTRNDVADQNAKADSLEASSDTNANTAAGDEARPTGAANLTGTWTGAYGPIGTAATLVIKEHRGTRWSGVLEQGRVRVAFVGSIDLASRKLTFKETELISGDGWSLGDNKGELSDDGRKMTGTGKDAIGAQLGISYDWSFSKR